MYTHIDKILQLLEREYIKVGGQLGVQPKYNFNHFSSKDHRTYTKTIKFPTSFSPRIFFCAFVFVFKKSLLCSFGACHGKRSCRQAGLEITEDLTISASLGLMVCSTPQTL